MIEKYIRNGTFQSPTINFDPKVGTLAIFGRSILENPIEFFKPLMRALDEYINYPKPTTSVIFNLEYSNAISSQSILTILRKFEAIHRNGSEVIVVWLYNAEDDFIDGEVYKTIIDIPFTLLRIN
jgi:hypothetical protein